MASLLIYNVLSSTVDIEYQYHDTEEVFGYTVVGDYVVNISDINFQQGDTVLLEGREAIKTAYGRPNIVARIGADAYLNGQIESYNFDSNPLVGSETVNIKIKEHKRLDSYASTNFAKYIPNPHKLSSFSENYSFSRDGGNYNSTRDVSITYDQEAGDQFLNDAKTFLTNYYFAIRPSFGYQEDGISEDGKIDKGYRGIITETYDLLGLSVKLSERVNSSFIDDSLHVGRDQKQSLEITKEGFLNKTYNINLSALQRDSEVVLTKALAEIVDEIITLEQQQFGNPFQISKGITKDGKTATLTMSFSTDPKRNQDTTESYSGGESKAGKFTEYTLQIAYKSNGKNNDEKFSNSKKAWVSGQQLNLERMQRLFHPTVPIYEKSRSTVFERSQGFVSENIGFTTDDSYKDNDDGILKFKKTLSKNHQINRINKFLNLSNLEEVVTVSDKKTVGSATVQGTLTVSQSEGIYKAKEELEAKTSEFNDLVDEDIIHITNDSVSLNLGEGTASRNIQYLYLKNG
jgi:hypothetical protein